LNCNAEMLFDFGVTVRPKKETYTLTAF
jgi:hypothetical protein